ncbi:hypothetical protein [Roseofilum capinflatum]|uniref:Uncharacterized protein n=1 Tax=Roseofilum capinflatum BLCC-M114 TaxID=3022440 RepID=A0ABT7B9A6_9CYAN|nr:hypothetical protein [Roseofilum capinflatum]MDJ1175750.1 hypothetical protein [Roseofilum capinflatum BLCC-M114]
MSTINNQETAKNRFEPQYDRAIPPTETASRQEREGENFKQTPDADGGIDTTGGYTMDREGKLNNFAVEPQMYVETPGDLDHKDAQLESQRQGTYQEVKETDEDGKLSMKDDNRGKGVGII